MLRILVPSEYTTHPGMGNALRWVEHLGVSEDAIAYTTRFSDIRQDPMAAALLPLEDVPLQKDGYVIAALSARTMPAFQIGMMVPFVHGMAALEGIYCPHSLGRRYLRELWPDCHIQDDPHDAHAHLCAWNETPITEMNHWQVLDQREWTPTPGAGTWALCISGDNAAWVPRIRDIHHPGVSRCTNIERALLIRFTEAGMSDAGIFVQEKAPGYIQVAMSWVEPSYGRVLRHGLTSGTILGLADTCWRTASQMNEKFQLTTY